MATTTSTTETTIQQTTKLRLAVVGCGQIVTHHLKAIVAAQLPLEIGALVDPQPQQRTLLQQLPALASLYSKSTTKHYDSLTDLMDDQAVLQSIQILFLAVPHDLHEPLATLALQGTLCFVVLEKPLSITKDSCDTLVQLSVASNGRLAVAEQSPHWPAVSLAKQLIAQGAIGNIVTASAYYYESMRDNVTSGDVQGNGGLGWRGSLQRAGGGIVLDGGLHWLRPLRELLRCKVQSVMAVSRTQLAPTLQLEGEVLCHALLELAPPTLDNGANISFLQPPSSSSSSDENTANKNQSSSSSIVATYSANMLATAPMAHDACPYFRVTGNQGELIIHGDGLFANQPGAGGLKLYNDTYPQGAEQFPNHRLGGFFVGFGELWKELYRIITTNDSAAAHESVLRAADDVATVLAMYRSNRTRQWEEP